MVVLTGMWCWGGWVSQNHINLVVVNNVPLFFNVRDGPYMPTLRLLHQCMWNVGVCEKLGFRFYASCMPVDSMSSRDCGWCVVEQGMRGELSNCGVCVVEDPGIMKKFRVDRGAIKFVLAGANIMCPGLTSAGGDLDAEVAADSPVVSSTSSL